MNFLPWIYASLALFGAGFFVLSLLIDFIGDLFENLFEGLDSVLETVGVDIIPDSLYVGEGESKKGVGCIAFFAFLAGFGASGLIASLSGANLFWSIAASLAFGLVTGAAYVLTMNFMLRQQGNTMTRESNLVGQSGEVTISISTSGKGQVKVIVSGAPENLPAVSADTSVIPRGTLVEVVSAQGGILTVKKK